MFYKCKEFVIILLITFFIFIVVFNVYQSPKIMIIVSKPDSKASLCLCDNHIKWRKTVNALNLTICNCEHFCLVHCNISSRQPN